MNDEAGFLQAIADQPGERVTRLAYADWLEENGRSQEAEFLKTQLQIEEMSARLIELGGRLDTKWLTTVGNVRVEPLWFILRTGRSLMLRELRQRDFYEGLLEGCPTSEQNREDVQRVVAEEESRRGQRPYLIQPIERPVKHKRRSSFGPRGMLPTIVCVGRFDSFQPARASNQDASELTIIWFQHEWAHPIDPGVREQIRAIDWDQHAHDFSW